MQRLDGKVVVITGGSGGIGLATARRVVAEGGRVLLFDLDEGALQAAAQALGPSAAWAAGDVTSLADQQAAVALAVERFGRLDGMHANAGIEGTVAPLTTQRDADFQRVLQVNVVGVWNSIRAAVPALTEAGGGSIVATSSVAGFIGSPGLGPYVTSKHAVIGLTRTAALELAPVGIRVNTVHPGPVDNRMMRSIEAMANPDDPAAVKAGFLQLVPLGRYATNEDIAAMVAFLMSADASYCTGQQYAVDGGFMAG